MKQIALFVLVTLLGVTNVLAENNAEEMTISSAYIQQIGCDRTLYHWLLVLSEAQNIENADTAQVVFSFSTESNDNIVGTYFVEHAEIIVPNDTHILGGQGWLSISFIEEMDTSRYYAINATFLPRETTCKSRTLTTGLVDIRPIQPYNLIEYYNRYNNALIGDIICETLSHANYVRKIFLNGRMCVTYNGRTYDCSGKLLR